MSRKAKPKVIKVIKAWSDVGSSGSPYVFVAGPFYEAYGPLLHIWAKKIRPDLVEVEIRVSVKPSQETKR